jgi:CheY-like chemotaxis protein
MNAIIGMTSIAMANTHNQEQVEECLRKIALSSKHLLGLINDVLDMSKIESGKMMLNLGPTSLREVMDSIVNIVQPQVRAKNQQFKAVVYEILTEDVCCDSIRINQVLINLLGNAVKFTPENGTVQVSLYQEALPKEPSYVRTHFLVKDTGIGMSEEYQKKIFDSFSREENARVQKTEGSGLGMAITQNIVDMMNGSISVKSEQGVGTEFIVAVTFRIHAGKKEQQDIPELKNCRALVVDDDFNTCDSVSYMLGQIGMRAEWTLSGKEAVLRTRQAVMRGDDYCVYIIDWLLPDMNGIEVTRRIRKEMGENVPIIVLTAYDWSDVEDEAKEAGVTAFCSKPLFMSELRSCLYSIVNTEEEKIVDSSVDMKFSTGHILLVEDNELNQEIAVEILGDAGFSTDVAENGKIAVEMLAASEPGYYQLVLMDIQMPVMNGYEAAKAIRKLESQELASVPILAMTANAFEEDRQEALRCGMNGHLPKPIDVENLYSTLKEILD